MIPLGYVHFGACPPETRSDFDFWLGLLKKGLACFEDRFLLLAAKLSLERAPLEPTLFDRCLGMPWRFLGHI